MTKDQLTFQTLYKIQCVILIFDYSAQSGNQETEDFESSSIKIEWNHIG